jgi:hypothetical protein
VLLAKSGPSDSPIVDRQNPSTTKLSLLPVHSSCDKHNHELNLTKKERKNKAMSLPMFHIHQTNAQFL